MSVGLGSITALSPERPLKPKETHSLRVDFNNMEACPLRYELTGWDSGSIDTDGLYTAPGREGSFEIRVTCPEHPQISTFAYITVQE